MGTTAEKLAYLKETKNQIKQALETPSNVMRDYANWIKKYVDNQPTSKVNDGVCTNALDVPIVRVGIDGNSYQGENPSPDNPQDIEVIDGVNLFDGEIELGCMDADSGELLDNNYRTRSKNFMKVKPNTTYKFIRTTGQNRWIIGYDKNKVGITDGNYQNHPSSIYMGSNGIREFEFTTTPTTEYIKWYDTSCTDLTEKLMIIKGTTPKPYLPYGCIGLEHTNEDGSKSEVIPINLNGNSIAKVGDVKDLLKVYRNGDVEIEKKRNRYVFTGNEDFSKQWINDGCENIYQCTNLLIDCKKEINNTSNVYSKSNSYIATHYDGGYDGIGSIWANRKNDNYPYLIATINKDYFNHGTVLFKDMRYTDVTDFKNYLKQQYNAGIPVYVDYELATPETIKLPSIEPIELWEGTNNFKLITNLDTTFEMEYVVNKDYLETQNLLNIVEGENI